MPPANGVWLQCHHCGKPIYRQKYRLALAERHFCDAKCRGKWQSSLRGPDTPAYKGTKTTVQCSQCGKTISRSPEKMKRNSNFFCCRLCYDEWRKTALLGSNNPNGKTPRISTTCAVCGKAIERTPSRYKWAKHGNHFCCPEHRAEWTHQFMSGPGSPNWKNGGVRYYGPNWSRQKRKARKRDGYQCRACGAKQKKGHTLHVHHIKPFRDFNYVTGENENYLQANDLSNLISLCSSCHKRVEAGNLSFQYRLID